MRAAAGRRSSLDLQRGKDVAGPLIACRCNNMKWSSAGVQQLRGNTSLHLACPRENRSSASIGRNVSQPLRDEQRYTIHSRPVLLFLGIFVASACARAHKLDPKPQDPAVWSVKTYFVIEWVMRWDYWTLDESLLHCRGQRSDSEYLVQQY